MEQRLNYSFVICTYNRAHLIGLCFDSFTRLKIPNSVSVELIVIDNNSQDHTKSVYESYVDRLNFDSRYFVEIEQGLSNARNLGIKKVTGDYIIFIDDDALLTSNYLVNLHDLLKNKNILVGGGKVIPYFIDEIPVWYNKTTRKLISEIDYGEKIKPLKNKYPFGANMWFHRKVFEKVGVFNPELGRKGNNLMAGEELDLFNRIAKENLQIYYTPDSSVYHIIPKNRTEYEFINKFCIGAGVSRRMIISNKKGTSKILALLFFYIKVYGGIFYSKWLLIRGKQSVSEVISIMSRGLRYGYYKKNW